MILDKINYPGIIHIFKVLKWESYNAMLSYNIVSIFN